MCSLPENIDTRALVVGEGIREEWDLSESPLCPPAGHREVGWGGPALGSPTPGMLQVGMQHFSRPAGALVRSRLHSTTRPAVPLPAAFRGFWGAGYPLPTVITLPNSSPNCHRALAAAGIEPSS